MDFSQNALVVVNFLAKRERILLLINLLDVLCFPAPLSLHLKPVNPPACFRLEPIFELGFVFSSFGFVHEGGFAAKLHENSEDAVAVLDVDV